MKVLHIGSLDGGYGVIEFDNYGKSIKEWVKEMEDSNITYLEVEYDDEKDAGGFTLEIREFGYVCPEFIDYMRYNLYDYSEESKHRDFFIIEEDEW